MKNSALVVIDLQNDITKNYKEIIEAVNRAIDWAAASGMHVVYIQHNNLSAGTRTFEPGTRGAELAPELKVVSDHIFVKTKSNALTRSCGRKTAKSSLRTSKTLIAEKTERRDGKARPAACVLRVCLIDKLEIINQT